METIFKFLEEGVSIYTVFGTYVLLFVLPIVVRRYFLAVRRTYLQKRS